MPTHPRRVVVVVYDGFQLLDVAGPVDVFDTATRGLRGEDLRLLEGDPVTLGPPADAPGRGYELVVTTLSGRPARSASGMRVSADAALTDIDPGSVDTLLVSGAPYIDRAMGDQRLIAQIRRVAGRARRSCSVCSGALLLGAAGLLDGRRATTHWAACSALESLFPAVQVEPDRIFVRDGGVVTSAGVTAGMDLALALVDEDHGPELACRVARWLVLFVQRPGGQSQFSERLALPLGAGSPIRELVDTIAADPAGNHRIPDLAHRAALSERHLARLFVEQTHTTPGRFVERIRVEAARDLLERTRSPVDAVAERSGFGSTETMRRAFQRVLGVGPNDYRQRFQRERAGSTERPAA